MENFSSNINVLYHTMPYSKCPNCNQLFHLTITKDLDQWYRKYAPDTKVGDEVAIQFFGCWKELKEYDVVRVISPPDANSAAKKDDISTVVMVLQSPDEKVYEVECVLPDGTTKWLETFKRNQLRYEPDLNKNNTEQGH
jgi:hypothetical protein